VNQQVLAPGDSVLFQGGATFADAPLMPASSGTSAAPIVFGSYGTGQADIAKGAWFIQDNLAFTNLEFNNTFFGGSNTKGTANNILLDGVSIQMADGNQSLGLFGNGTGWTIEDSTINNSGLSGMLLWGSGYLIAQNTITNTGTDTSNGYNNHGIYLDASDTTITGNTIENFAASGISVRYHGSVIEGNLITGGQIGIDFFQTDPVAGQALWTGNTIAATTTAGIYISPSGAAGATMESFTIAGNALHIAGGVFMNLAPTTGTMHVADNVETSAG
jgi:putative cofactor-binding repeat protein